MLGSFGAEIKTANKGRSGATMAATTLKKCSGVHGHRLTASACTMLDSATEPKGGRQQRGLMTAGPRRVWVLSNSKSPLTFWSGCCFDISAVYTSRLLS